MDLQERINAAADEFDELAMDAQMVALSLRIGGGKIDLAPVIRSYNNARRAFDALGKELDARKPTEG